MDQISDQISRPAASRPSLDLQTHLAELDAQGLLLHIDRPINKDTELHPLVRCAFTGGTPEEERRAFLFNNVVDGDGRRYDMPVVVGALAASPRIYAIGMGRPIDDIGAAWIDAIAHPIEPMPITGPAPSQDVVITEDELRGPSGGLARLPVPISTPGFDAAPYLTLTLCITRDPETRVQNMGMYRAQLKASDRLGVRMSTRAGGAGGYAHWLKYRDRREPMPCAIVVGAAPVIVYTGPQNLALDQDEMAVAGALAGAPIRTMQALSHRRLIPSSRANSATRFGYTHSNPFRRHAAAARKESADRYSVNVLPVYGIGDGGEDNRDRRRSRFCSKRRRGASRGNHVHLALDQIGVK